MHSFSPRCFLFSIIHFSSTTRHSICFRWSLSNESSKAKALVSFLDGSVFELPLVTRITCSTYLALDSLLRSQSRRLCGTGDKFFWGGGRKLFRSNWHFSFLHDLRSLFQQTFDLSTYFKVWTIITLKFLNKSSNLIYIMSNFKRLMRIDVQIQFSHA